MSYCVNCGVELQKGERKCPLCGVEVVNPREPWTEETAPSRPYPAHVERLNARIDRHYAATFCSLLLLIPLFVSMFTNMLISGALTWSLYVAGGLLVVFVCVFLPMLFKKRRVYLFVLLDGASVALLLLLIEHLSEQQWFLTLGLPLCCIATLLTLLIAFLCAPKRSMDGLVRAAVALAGLGATVVLIECAVRFYLGMSPVPRWSVYALFPCLVIAAGMLLLKRLGFVFVKLLFR